MKKFFGDERPENYGWFMKGTDGWTGVTMVVLMLVAYVLAQSWFRRNRANLPKSLKRLTGFNAFWYSHHLFVIVYVLLIVHGYFVYLSKEWYHKTVRIHIFFLASWLITECSENQTKRSYDNFCWWKHPLLLLPLDRRGCIWQFPYYYMHLNDWFVHLDQVPRLSRFWRYFYDLFTIIYMHSCYYRQKSRIYFTFLISIDIKLIFRWQYIQEMYFHFTCRSLKVSSTQVDSTYILTVLTSHHYNGIRFQLLRLPGMITSAFISAHSETGHRNSNPYIPRFVNFPQQVKVGSS